MKIVFWFTAFLCIYSYVIYPAIIFLWAKIVRNHWKSGEITPSISIIISVYNEESVISAKLKNALALNYPPDLMEIIVISDGSTDRTNEIVASTDDPRISLYELPRMGKSACLNQVVPKARGDIVLFTDANAMFPVDTLRKLVRHFNDECIGLVTGGTSYLSVEDGRDVTGLYAKLERWTKLQESRISSCVGADGAIFAIRRNLFVPLQGNAINDFIIPLNVLEKRYRVVLDPEVNCKEPASDDGKKAFRRQVRITNRTLWAIFRNLHFTNPKRFGSFAFFLISHKVLRFGVPFFFLLTGLFNVVLIAANPLFVFTFFIYVSFVVVGILSHLKIIENKIANICKFFLITIIAQMIGALRMMVGIEDQIWTPER